MEIHITRGEAGHYLATSPQIDEFRIAAVSARDVLAAVSEVVLSIRARAGSSTTIAVHVKSPDRFLL